MPAPVLASSSSVNSGSGTSTTLTAPASITNNDLLVITLALDGASGNPSVANDGTGAAWVREISEDNGGNQELFVFMKIAASETGNYTVSWTGTEGHVCRCDRITGALTSDFYETGTINNSSGTSSPAVALSMTPNTDNNLMYAVYSIDRNRITDGQADDGTGWTTSYIIEYDSAGGVACGVSTKNLSQTASSDGNQALSTNDTWTAIQIAFRSEAPPTPSGFSLGFVMG